MKNSLTTNNGVLSVEEMKKALLEEAVKKAGKIVYDKQNNLNKPKPIRKYDIGDNVVAAIPYCDSKTFVPRMKIVNGTITNFSYDGQWMYEINHKFWLNGYYINNPRLEDY